MDYSKLTDRISDNEGFCSSYASCEACVKRFAKKHAEEKPINAYYGKFNLAGKIKEGLVIITNEGLYSYFPKISIGSLMFGDCTIKYSVNAEAEPKDKDFPTRFTVRLGFSDKNDSLYMDFDFDYFGDESIPIFKFLDSLNKIKGLDKSQKESVIKVCDTLVSRVKKNSKKVQKEFEMLEAHGGFHSSSSSYESTPQESSYQSSDNGNSETKQWKIPQENVDKTYGEYWGQGFDRSGKLVKFHWVSGAANLPEQLQTLARMFNIDDWTKITYTFIKPESAKWENYPDAGTLGN